MNTKQRADGQSSDSRGEPDKAQSRPDVGNEAAQKGGKEHVGVCAVRKGSQFPCAAT